MEGARNGLLAKMNDRVDPYGFEIASDSSVELHRRQEERYLPVLARRAVKWDKLLRHASSAHVHRSGKVKRYVRKGVPNAHRPDVWMAVSGAQALMESNADYYARLLAQDKDPDMLDAVRTDLNRTFPENVYFQEGVEPSLKASLCRVLSAYGHHNQEVGYCQGMNFIAGYLLLITHSEEKAFWLMDALIGRILPDYYTRDMLGVRVDQEVLSQLLQAKAPLAAGHVMALGVPWALLTARWFLCLFIDVLPVETVLRVWDALLYEGSKVLFRVAIALVRRQQPVVMAARCFPEVVAAFRAMERGDDVTDCHTFMRAAFVEPGSLSMATLSRLRESTRAAIVRETENHARGRGRGGRGDGGDGGDGGDDGCD